MTYTFDTFGTLVLEDGRGTVLARHAADGRLGFLFDADDGTLHKHGGADAVAAHAATLRDRLAAVGCADLAATLTLVEVPVAALETPAVLAEVNACLSCSGRIARLAERLAVTELARDFA